MKPQTDQDTETNTTTETDQPEILNETEKFIEKLEAVERDRKESEVSEVGEEVMKDVMEVETKEEVLEDEKKDKILMDQVQDDGETFVTPREALRRGEFYKLWLTRFSVVLITQSVSGFYKAYGQTFIKDDHFLSFVGAVSSIFNCSGTELY